MLKHFEEKLEVFQILKGHSTVALLDELLKVVQRQ